MSSQAELQALVMKGYKTAQLNQAGYNLKSSAGLPLGCYVKIAQGAQNRAETIFEDITCMHMYINIKEKLRTTRRYLKNTSYKTTCTPNFMNVRNMNW